VGREGYSIIGQGKVEQIISSKPEDRRTIFEDAAGISKFKARKNEAENELRKYRENLSRTNDIMTEIERRLGPLKRQSEDAKRSLALRDTLKDLEINAYIYQYDNASVVKEEINVRKKGYNDNLTIKQNEYDNLQIKYDGNMAEIDRVDKTISELHDKVLNLTVQLEKKQGENNLLSERMLHIEEQTKRVASEVDNLELNHKQLEILLDNANKSKDAENKTLKALRIESEKLSNEYLELIDKTISEWVDNYNNTGVSGRLFTGTNGNTLFLPAVGIAFDNMIFMSYSGSYWAASLNQEYAFESYYLYIIGGEDEDLGKHSINRFIGFPIRGVKEANK
jgi:chromosome segregation protein